MSDSSAHDGGASAARRTPSTSAFRLQQLMQPTHASHRYNVHGGIIMKKADEAGAVAAMRHAGATVVTVAAGDVEFTHPVHVGDVLECEARVVWVGRTSLEVDVVVHVEEPTRGARHRAARLWLVYVALDPDERPTPVPPLVLETDDERARAGRADERRRRSVEASRSG